MKIKQCLIIVIVCALCVSSVTAQEMQVQNLTDEIQSSKTTDKAIILVYSETEWIGSIQDGNYITFDVKGTGNDKFLVNCGDTNTITYSITNLGSGLIETYTIRQGVVLDYQTSSEPEIIDALVSCNDTNPLQNNTIYYTIAIIIAIITAIILILKKKPVLGPRKFRT